MKMMLLGYEHVTPKSGKAPFTMLHVTYPKHGVTGKTTEQIYVADDFPLPNLAEDMLLDIDRDGRGYLLAVTEATHSLKLNK